MGVPGLWEILNKAGKSKSIARLAIINGFEQNASERRAYRIGIDVSLWFHHSQSSKGGENCELRNLFFRLIFLAKLPIIPLFMFDGRHRPKVKRGSRLGKSGSHELSKDFKKFLEAFGMEWREAPGEAEAELASLNAQGLVDAIMTDDCDAFIFGARTLIKNMSYNLSGNKNNQALNEDDKGDKLHAMVYDASEFITNPEIKLTRGGMVLFALLAGGDYDNGVDKIGKVVAHGLAKCDFGDDLLSAYTNLQGEDLQEFLVAWRQRVTDELRTNSRGFLPHRKSAASLPANFPKLDILEKYANPVCSQSRSSSLALRDKDELDLRRVAQLCEEYFEWGYRTRVIERFRTLMWPPVVIHILRRAALEVDLKEKSRPGSATGSKAVGTPAGVVQRYLTGKKKAAQSRTDAIADVFVRRAASPEPTLVATNDIPDPHPLIMDIVGQRQHSSMDNVLEYRVDICPVQLVLMVSGALKGTRAVPPEAIPKANDDPNASLRLWLPAAMLERVHPAMVERFVAKQSNKAQKGKGKGKKRATVDSYNSDERTTPSTSQSTAPRTPANDARAAHGTVQNQVIYQRQPSYDPWFTADTPPPSPPRNLPREGFLFTFRDPSFEEIPELDVEKDDEEEIPLSKTKMDRLFDQIINGAPKASQSKPKPKKRASKKRAVANDELQEPPAKRPRKSLLEVLDSLDLT